MPEPDEMLVVVREWVEKAENDLKNAAHTLEMGDDAPTDTICFHAQQCVEKYLKAFLVTKGTDFPKTHEITRIMALLPEGSRPDLAVEIARRVRDEVRGLLPDGARP